MTYDRDAKGIPTAQYVKVSPVAQDTINRQEGISNYMTGVAGQRALGIPLSDYNIDSPYGQEQATERIGQLDIREGDRFAGRLYDPTQYGDLDQYQQNVADTYMDQQRRQLDPVWDKNYERTTQDLANRGFGLNKGFQDSMSQFNRDRDDAYQQAANQAVLMSGQEADRRRAAEQGLRATAIGEDLQGHQQRQADIGNVLQAEQGYRQSDMQDDLLQRTQNINEISALFQGAPALQMPQGRQLPSYQMQAPNVIGAHNNAFNQQMAAYNADTQRQAAAGQGMVGIASGLGKMATKSSRAWKHDHKETGRILDRVEPLEIKAWRYLPHIDPRQEVHIGPYAEDWKRALNIGDGKHIDMIDAFGVTLKCVQELYEEVNDLKAEVKRLKGRKK